MIRAAGAHYLIGAKANQPKLLAAMEALSATTEPMSTWEDHERTRDRQTRRTVCVYAVPAQQPFTLWPDLACAVLVDRSGTRGGEPYAERRWYLTSLLSSAQHLGKIVRGHWEIENSLHWVKDVVLKEDACRTCVGQAPQNLALLRTMAVTVYRMSGYRSIIRALRRHAHDIDALMRLLE